MATDDEQRHEPLTLTVTKRWRTREPVTSENKGPPRMDLMALMGSALLAQCVHVAARLGLADRLAAGPMRIDALAEAVDCQAAPLLRVMRVLCKFGLFIQTGEEQFTIGPAADRLRSDHPRSVRHFCMLSGQEYYQGYGALLHTVRTGQSGIKHVYGGSIYEYMERSPETARVYDQAMFELSRDEALELAAGYPFDGVRTIVDVGGGSGVVVRSILRAHPELNGICVDREHVCTRAAQDVAASADADLLERLRFVPGDFFGELPGGGDLYIVKNVLHNWKDDNCVRILESVRQAMPEGAKLLVVEHLMESDEAELGRLMNAVIQVVICEDGTTERSEARMREIVTRAGFEVTRKGRFAAGHDWLEAVLPPVVDIV
jgi:C-methyltransferase